MSQRWLSNLERGRIEAMTLRDIGKVCAALDISVRLDVWWRGGDGDRLLDRDHAAIVEFVVQRLQRDGWGVRLEYGFNHYGDRGSVDILAWNAVSRSLLIIEVKASVTDIQALLAALAKKVRVVPGLVRGDGWRPLHTSYVLVVLGTRANRTIITRHAQTFETTFPDASRSVLSWLRSPTGAIRGLWFVAPASLSRGTRPRPRPKRVRPVARSTGGAG
jgi:hypothetical protein